MNFVIINSLIGVFILFSSTTKLFQSVKNILILALVGAFLSLGIAWANFVDLSILGMEVNNSFFQFNKYTALFLLCMQACFIFYLLLHYKDFLTFKRSLNEQIALLFFVLTGCAILLSYTNLLMLFLGIEIVSIPLYVLTGVEKNKLKGNEASLKYLLLGALSTCFLLMGICLIYGATGSFQFQDFTSYLMIKDKLFLGGLLFVIIAFSFKVSAAPFHFWTPDIYEGAPIIYTSFMATIVKSFLLLAFFRLFNFNWELMTSNVFNQILLLVVCTLIIGNFTAVFQQGFTRLMAYSSISQVGFMLLAILGNKQYANEGILLYTISYTLASMSIFSIIAKSSNGSIENLKGLGKSQPLIALFLTIYLLSLAGIPLTAGFLSKYYMILSVLKNHSSIYLIILLVTASTISAFYYLRLIQNIYFKERTIEGAEIVNENNAKYKILLMGTAILLLILGLQPSFLLTWLNF